MTLDELQANPTTKLAVSKLAEIEGFQILQSVLDDEYRKLGYMGRTAGLSSEDKIEAGGQVQGYNKCQHVIRQCLALPKLPPKDIQATYPSPTPPVQTTVQRPKPRETK